MVNKGNLFGKKLRSLINFQYFSKFKPGYNLIANFTHKISFIPNKYLYDTNN